MMKASALLVTLVCATLLIFPACGKKGDPLPPVVPGPAIVLRLEAEQMEGAIAVSWRVLPEKKGEGEIFRIFRREIEPTSCPGCPQEYPRIADLPFADCSAAGAVCNYRDSAIEPGRLYGYRIAVCSNSGMCSAASDEVLIRYKNVGTKP